MSSNIFKYLDLDSTYRDRTQFLNPADFDIPLSTSGQRGQFNAKDPVSLASPYESSTFQAGSTTNVLVLNAGSLDSKVPSFYNGTYIENVSTGEISLITSYAYTTQSATITPAFAMAPSVGASYRIYYAKPFFSGTLQAGSTASSLVLPNTTSALDNFYNGQFVQITSGADSGQIRQITSYVGSTHTATIPPLLSAPSPGDTFYLDQFSYDNFTPLKYSGTDTKSQAVCYAVELLWLSIPIQQLTTYPGLITWGQHIYVSLYSVGNKHVANNVIYSNNPNSGQALFKVPITGQSDAAGFPFLVLKDARMVQTVKWKTDEALHFNITFGDGNPLVFATADKVSPAPPDPLLQISVLFSLKRIDT